MTSNEKQSRKQRRAAERAARKGGGTSSAKTSSSGGSSGPSIVVISLGAIVIGVIAVLALVLVSGGLGDDAAAVADPDTPAPAEELRQGRTLVAQDATEPVEIQLFEDAQCPHCQTFTERVEPLIIAEHVVPGTASLTYADYIVFGEQSLDAAVAMRAAEELDGAFWDYHHSLYHNAPDGAFTREWLADIAESIGLDRDEFTALLDDADLQEAVAAEHAAGSGLGVQSTPSVVIDGELLVSRTWEDISDAILAAAAAK